MGEGSHIYGNRGRSGSGSKRKNPPRQAESRPQTLTAEERRRRGTERLLRKSNINGGLTKAQQVAVEKFENKHRDYKTERVAAIDSKGRIVAQSTSGKRDRTRLGYIPENCVITHNHPTVSGGVRQTTGVGGSFSHTDIRTAMRRNATEIRAVSANYTYSLRRPAGGWKADPDKVYKDYSDAFNKYTLELFGKYRGSSSISATPAETQRFLTRHQRANSLASHFATRDMAKKYGFDYTRRRTK